MSKVKFTEPEDLTMCLECEKLYPRTKEHFFTCSDECKERRASRLAEHNNCAACGKKYGVADVEDKVLLHGSPFAGYCSQGCLDEVGTRYCAGCMTRTGLHSGWIELRAPGTSRRYGQFCAACQETLARRFDLAVQKFVGRAYPLPHCFGELNEDCVDCRLRERCYRVNVDLQRLAAKMRGEEREFEASCLGCKHRSTVDVSRMSGTQASWLKCAKKESRFLGQYVDQWDFCCGEFEEGDLQHERFHVAE